MIIIIKCLADSRGGDRTSPKLAIFKSMYQFVCCHIFLPYQKAAKNLLLKNGVGWGRGDEWERGVKKGEK